MSLILCVDPGIANSGAAIINPQDGSIVDLAYCHTDRSDKKLRWRSSDDSALRCQIMARFYRQLIQQHSINRLMAELPIGGAPNSDAATHLARAGAVVVTVAEVFDCATEWYSPTEVKRAVTGRASASKKEMMDTVASLYPVLNDRFPTLVSGREHVADAIGVWLAGRHGALARL